ncbi:alpha/beta hydrolase [Paenibacillus roseipurpureus]|uniref:Alpha/beta hydrolase n=1 Tax=Paenibacillus roseopurpureus TaxID=2918901 RepID=A0AA96RK28_9BACL|nr:alpha/beta hydrolase [Paenibacillus sp. MBLB1832]WNR44405.1 alpha/beta hydrolase [Paenibacillus sp. MBLB1832]
MTYVRRHWWKWLIGGGIIFVAVIVWFLRPYQASEAAFAAMKSDENVTVSEEGHFIRFEPKTPVQPSMIYYPGGLVKPESYATYAHALAQAGHRTYIVKMPVNLAVLGGDRAAAILAKRGQDETFVIGGHSLGGVMAARFAAAHAAEFSGVFFLASYPDPKGSLVSANLPVISLIGSNDGEVNKDTFAKAKNDLPPTTEYHTIQGGNHSQFGSYGFQKGDNASSISPQEQLDETVQLLLNWEKTLKAK